MTPSDVRRRFAAVALLDQLGGRAELRRATTPCRRDNRSPGELDMDRR